MRADERTAARQAFEQAVEVYEFLGAEADLNRVQAEFRAHGIRRGPHSKHRRAVSGWDSLTDTELKVAAFVEEGLSNPEIAARLMLSRRTVATHVSHILKKLDVTTGPTSRGSRRCAPSPLAKISLPPRESPSCRHPRRDGDTGGAPGEGPARRPHDAPAPGPWERGRVAAVAVSPRRLVARHHHVRRLRHVRSGLSGEPRGWRAVCGS